MPIDMVAEVPLAGLSLTRELGDDALIGVCEVNSAWPSGYGSMTIVPYPSSLAPAVNVE